MAYVPMAIIRRAFRRSRLRVGSVLALDELGPSTLADLAIALGAERANVLGALVGNGETYRVADSLLRLGLVAQRAVRGEVVFVLTAAGRRIAGRLRRERTARRRSRSIARAHST